MKLDLADFGLLQASHSSSSAVMPEWMKRMHTAVECNQVSKPVRLFLVKVVLHVERRHAERASVGQQAGNSPASPQLQQSCIHHLPCLI